MKKIGGLTESDFARAMYRSLHHLVNREHDLGVSKKWYKKKRYKQGWWLLTAYGLTFKEYKAMIRSQGGRCALCLKKKKPLCVDHCHTSGTVRGLLCRHCNTLMIAIDDQSWLTRALRYKGDAK